MTSREAWLDTIKNHSDLVRTKAMARACQVISDMPMERILEKFEVGQHEHDEDPSGIPAEMEFENEAIDMICYEALLLSRGNG